MIDWVVEWNEDQLIPRYGEVINAGVGGWVQIRGCNPRVGDAFVIIGHVPDEKHD